MFKNKLNKRTTLNLGGVICLALTVYFISNIVLLQDVLPFSIASTFCGMSHTVRHWHVLVVGFLPIYVALMIFGTATIGVYFGSAVHHWIVQFFRK